MEKIKLYIISGFLGSGKTTFLKHILSEFSNVKVGVIINEFGKIGIDGKTISKDGIEYVELNNGSIFCTCIKANFVKTLVHLQKEDIDVLIIENSGLADPSSMNSLLDELKPYMHRGYEYKGSICLVDCESFLDYVDTLPPLENQILSSSFVIMNKVDLVDNPILDEVEAKIKDIKQDVYLYKTTFAQLPIELLDENLYNSGYNSISYNTKWNRPAVYTIKASEKYDRSKMIGFLNRVCKYAVRIKGFVNTNEGYIHIDCVGEKVLLRPATQQSAVQAIGIVVIGKDSVDFRSEVTSAWQDIVGTQIKYIDKE